MLATAAGVCRIVSIRLVHLFMVIPVFPWNFCHCRLVAKRLIRKHCMKAAAPLSKGPLKILPKPALPIILVALHPEIIDSVPRTALRSCFYALLLVVSFVDLEMKVSNRLLLLQLAFAAVAVAENISCH